MPLPRGKTVYLECKKDCELHVKGHGGYKMSEIEETGGNAEVMRLEGLELNSEPMKWEDPASRYPQEYSYDYLYLSGEWKYYPYTYLPIAKEGDGELNCKDYLKIRGIYPFMGSCLKLPNGDSEVECCSSNLLSREGIKCDNYTYGVGSKCIIPVHDIMTAYASGIIPATTSSM